MRHTEFLFLQLLCNRWWSHFLLKLLTSWAKEMIIYTGNLYRIQATTSTLEICIFEALHNMNPTPWYHNKGQYSERLAEILFRQATRKTLQRWRHDGAFNFGHDELVFLIFQVLFIFGQIQIPNKNKLFYLPIVYNLYNIHTKLSFGHWMTYVFQCFTVGNNQKSSFEYYLFVWKQYK